MNVRTHHDLAGFIWGICNLLRGPYKRNEYRKVILPMTVLRRFDCLLAPTKARVLAEHQKVKGKPESVVRAALQKITKYEFYNVSKLEFASILNAPSQLAADLVNYINGFSPNVREIMDRFAFGAQIARMAEKNILFEVVKAFGRIDLTYDHVDNLQMGYAFEELIRIGAEQSNEEAGEHFTPREVIRLMVNLLLSPEPDIGKSHVVKTIYDPACGTGGMLSEAEKFIRAYNSESKPLLFGQDWNDEAYAVCKADMLIKGQNAENIKLGDTFSSDHFSKDAKGEKLTFDYMLANPPFGVEWKQQEKKIRDENRLLGFDGRFGAGLPRINDGALLFLQHMIAKMRPPESGGSRIAIVFNGSPLFTGDAGSGESEIRRWIIENDWLEAIVALPDQLFYNTGISTYIWVLTNRKEKRRKGKIQLLDARNFYEKMKKSLGNKRNRIAEGEDGEADHVGQITQIYGNFKDGETFTFHRNGESKSLTVCRLFDNDDFGYRKITVERPLRLNFAVSEDRIVRLELQTAFQNLASSKKKSEKQRQAEVEAGEERQKLLRAMLQAWAKEANTPDFKNREAFIEALKAVAAARDVRLSAAEVKFIVAALGERDPSADVCTDRHGDPEPDSDLRDTESVPMKEAVQTYFEREVLPHVQDAWVDESKTKVGYEIPFNRHFYVYEPPRPLETIEGEIKDLERDIVKMLASVTGTKPEEVIR